MTRDDARSYFREKGLTYADVTRSDLLLLNVLLDLQFTKLQGANKYWTRTNCVAPGRAKFDENGRLLCALLTGKGECFTSRETVSFDQDGFIGFCGYADAENAAPVLAAFAEWCDTLASMKAVAEGGDDDDGVC